MVHLRMDAQIPLLHAGTLRPQLAVRAALALVPDSLSFVHLRAAHQSARRTNRGSVAADLKSGSVKVLCFASMCAARLAFCNQQIDPLLIVCGKAQIPFAEVPSISGHLQLFGIGKTTSFQDLTHRSATVCDRMSAVVADSGTVQANTSLAMAPKPRYRQ